MHQGKSTVGSEAQEEHAYPLAGASNVKVCLGVVPVIGGSVTWIDLFCGGNPDDEYQARVNWMHGNILVSQVLNMSHSKLKLIKFNIKTCLDGPLEIHLYRAKLFLTNALESPVKLTHGKGKHVVIQAKDYTIRYGALYKPDEETFGPPPYKTMLYVYGGPDVQLVSDSWANTVDMRAQYLRSKGILVWKVSECQRNVPSMIMTSDDTHVQTSELLESNFTSG
ncbi:dipeptidyl aminopeptidase 4 isoform X1 [Tanacetum coccineum]